MKLNSSNIITIILVLSIGCFAMASYTFLGSSNIMVGKVTAPKSMPTYQESPRKTSQRADTSYGTEITILADGRGHFWLDAVVDRTSIRFMIDTGATQTVLAYDDARNLGVDVERIDYNAPVQTGAGQAQFGNTQLPYVESGQLRIDQLDALVAPRDALPHSVLGNNFLRRLRSYSVESGKMTLVP